MNRVSDQRSAQMSEIQDVVEALRRLVIGTQIVPPRKYYLLLLSKGFLFHELFFFRKRCAT